MHRAYFIPFSNTHCESIFLRQYVLTKPLPFSEPAYIYAEIQPGYQCYLWRVTLADTQRSSDFFGDNHPAEVVDTPHYSGSFHIQISLKNYLANVLQDYCLE